MKCIADEATQSTTEPPGAVFFHDKEIEQCSSILGLLMRTSLSTASAGNRRSVPLPGVDLPMIF
ncbi:hypothetical protein [Paraburkholderia hospita]|uniref:hypothetical protein n=1 Tax=Paraburkholderia hospita TaxID=169430 RepID=UPI003ECCBB48